MKIIALGSISASDDALALKVAEKLKSISLPSEVEVIEADRDPSKLVSEVDGCDKLIVVDTIRIGAQPGTIHRIEIDSLKPSRSITIHNIDTATMIKLALTLASEKPREIAIIGLEPYSISLGEKLTPEIEEKIDKLIEEILKEISMRNT